MIFDTTLCFPETRPEPFSRRYLPLFFETLFYFTPTNPTLATTACPDGQGQFSLRNPFADDRDSSRFARLARELAGRGREYYRHFLAAQPQTGGGSITETSVASLVSLFTGQSPEMSDSENQQRQRRWHARLVLLLATLLTEDETRNRQMSGKTLPPVNDRCWPLCREREEQMPPIGGPACSPGRPFYPEYSPQQLKNLLQAVATFYLSDATARQALPCTTHSAGADLLFELYEKKSRQSAIELASLRLPTDGPDGERCRPGAPLLFPPADSGHAPDPLRAAANLCGGTRGG